MWVAITELLLTGQGSYLDDERGLQANTGENLGLLRASGYGRHRLR